MKQWYASTKFYSCFLNCRKNGGAEDNMVATEAAEGIKARGRGAPGLGWDLKGGRHPSTWSFRNMATMKVTGNSL